MHFYDDCYNFYQCKILVKKLYKVTKKCIKLSKFNTYNDKFYSSEIKFINPHKEQKSVELSW